MGSIGQYIADLVQTPEGIAAFAGVIVVLLACVIGLKVKKNRNKEDKK